MHNTTVASLLTKAVCAAGAFHISLRHTSTWSDNDIATVYASWLARSSFKLKLSSKSAVSSVLATLNLAWRNMNGKFQVFVVGLNQTQETFVGVEAIDRCTVGHLRDPNELFKFIVPSDSTDDRLRADELNETQSWAGAVGSYERATWRGNIQWRNVHEMKRIRASLRGRPWNFIGPSC